MDMKISQLPVATSTTGPDLYTLVQGGVNKSITFTAFMASSGVYAGITSLSGDITAIGPGATTANLTAITNSTLTTLTSLQLPNAQVINLQPLIGAWAALGAM